MAPWDFADLYETIRSLCRHLWRGFKWFFHERGRYE